MDKEKRFNFIENLSWHGTFLIIIIALLDITLRNYYPIPESLLGGKWFYISMICFAGMALHLLRKNGKREQWTFKDLFK